MIIDLNKTFENRSVLSCVYKGQKQLTPYFLKLRNVNRNA